MLNLRLARSPLAPAENEQILREYNRLTKGRIPMNEFEHWVQNSPAGPAWHAILETVESRIVGHTSLIPLRTSYREPGLIPAKSEFSFVHEEFRSAKINGYERGRIKFLVLVNELFNHGITEGWGPYFVSTAEANHALSRRVGCKTAEFPLWECMLLRRAVGAARETPNLSAKQRAGLFAVGVGHKAAWMGNRVLGNGTGKIRTIAVGSGPVETVTERLSLFEDLESLRWRYFEEQYVRFAFEGSTREYAIVKRGEADRYVRVVQWRLTSTEKAGAVIGALLRQAEKDDALGVRWAVYDHDAIAGGLVSAMKKRGFLCVRRVRTLMLHSKRPEFLEAANWNVNDSLVSFDP